MSVASYECDEGYQPNVSSNVTSSVFRVCRDNGMWSGTTIACGEQFNLYSTMHIGRCV